MMVWKIVYYLEGKKKIEFLLGAGNMAVTKLEIIPAVLKLTVC